MRHPLVHDLVITTAAPTVLLAAPDGQLRGTGAHGLLHGDRRVLSGAVLTVAGREPEPVSATGGFLGLLRHLDTGHNPPATVRRRRTVRAGVLTEHIDLDLPRGDHEVRVVLWTDFATIDHVRSGVQDPTVRPTPAGWYSHGLRVHITAPDAHITTTTGELILDWTATGRTSLQWTVEVDDPEAVFTPAEPLVPTPEIICDDPRLAAVLTRAVSDLNSLLLSDGANTFAAAGAPWYLTLFGRDSLWTARLGLPWTLDLAVGTLHALSRLQGAKHDPATGEAPGKIPHEQRRTAFRLGDMLLPPLYYGTIDATALWVCLLHDTWRHGFTDLEPLLPTLNAALTWLTTTDGRYHDETGHGLANQGWKDSHDAIRHPDGRHATPPIALPEVQAYNHEALLAGAALLEAFPDTEPSSAPGKPTPHTPSALRARAAAIAESFRATFWVDGIPALALDGHNTPVATPASNMAHLLGTGLLTPTESATIAARLAEPDLTSGFGLRTMSTTAAAYHPLSYHCGSVWPHDTAIAIRALAASGFPDHAATLATDLLHAAASIGELPELYAGHGRDEVPSPIPYPTSCRPQAWSSAAALTILTALLGLRVDGTTITVTPPRPSPVGALTARAIPLPGGTLTITVDRSGDVSHVDAPPTYTVLNGLQGDPSTP